MFKRPAEFTPHTIVNLEVATRRMAALLKEIGEDELEWQVGDQRIRVARHPRNLPSATFSVDSTAVTSPATEPPKNTSKDAERPGTVKSPIVGIAYLASEPGKAPFVRLDDMVKEGDTLLIIEAMKVMNQIRSPRAGRITRIFVVDAEPVEYGAALMLVE